jgi:hypothetical protein
MDCCDCSLVRINFSLVLTVLSFHPSLSALRFYSNPV